jgi:hypothetical protein
VSGRQYYVLKIISGRESKNNKNKTRTESGATRMAAGRARHICVGHRTYSNRQKIARKNLTFQIRRKIAYGLMSIELPNHQPLACSQLEEEYRRGAVRVC